MKDSSDIHRKETAFHDDWARSTKLEEINVREAFECPTAMENQFILRWLQPLNGLRVLDVGAGLGESSVYFALQGARVTASDISPGMVETAKSLAALHGVEVDGLVMTGEDLQVPAESFDVVYLANVIHHVTDRDRLFAGVRRALKPGGRFCSFDPVAYNPVINHYRRMATEVRTEDESPLRRADLELARRYFPDVRHREFWLASLALFIKYWLVDGVHPNQDRYWKRIYKETRGGLFWWYPLRAADSILTRLPLLHWWCWNAVLYGTKPPA